MHYLMRKNHLANLLVVLGGSSLSVASGLIAATIYGANQFIQALLVAASLVGIVGGIFTGVGGTILVLKRVKSDSLVSAYERIIKEKNLYGKVVTLQEFPGSAHRKKNL